MPIYCFRCPIDDKLVEEVRPVSEYDNPAPLCPECGTQTKLAVSPTSFSLKGSGWPSKTIKQGF